MPVVQPRGRVLRFIAALAVVFFHFAFRGHAADDLSTMDYPLLAPAAIYGFFGCTCSS